MMKLSVTVCVMFVLINKSACEQNTWFPNVINRITNTSNSYSNYLQEKGQVLKDKFLDVKNKITSYFSFLDQNTVSEKDEETRKKRKFKDYIDKAQETERRIIDVMTARGFTGSGGGAAASAAAAAGCKDDDPAVLYTTPQLIASHGYNAESHTVVTQDGYILTLHRIPYFKNKTHKLVPRKTVLLHHGLLGSSADWVIAGPKKSLAYLLSDAGYDVWLANVRGNTYSRAHLTWTTNSREFWNFTFHEVSQYDLPAVIDYIMDLKGLDVKINYIGHSMGTTVLFALLSTKTEYNKILRAGFALAPVAYMSVVKSPIHLLAPYSSNIEYLMKLLGADEFLPQNSILRWLSRFACELNHYEEIFCENSMFVLCGHDEQQFNKTLLPLILGHVPAGASTKTLIHYAQEIRNRGRFQQFDYGLKDNLIRYGSKIPPEYPVHKITLPIGLLSAKNDWLASEIDVSNLYLKLKNPIAHYVVPLDQFNHIDFLWAVDAPSLVYDKLLQLLDEGIYNEATFLDNSLF